MEMIKIGILDRSYESMAEAIKRNVPNSSSVPVLKMGISTTANLLIMSLIVLMITVFTGDFLHGIYATAAFCFLRYFSGGLHIRSVNICNFFSAGIILICVYTPISYWYNGLVINILSVILLACYAPHGIKKSKLSVRYYPVLKAISIVIVSINFLLHSPLLAIVFFMQAITTIPALSAFMKRMNW